jgi:DNA-binding transcriptional LysR family regulator
MMNLRQMEVFHAIMQTGSVTAAARMLHVTQPAVSAVLKHCEEQLGLRLFERAGGRLQPTREAEAIFPDIAGVFGQLDEVKDLTQDLAAGRVGRLRIAGSFPIANGDLARAVAEFVIERPKVQVDLQSLTSPQAVDQVVSREVELGVVYGPVTNPEVETEVLLRSGLACIMRENHPLARRRRVKVTDLRHHSLITYLPQTLLRNHVDEALLQAGVTPDLKVQVALSITGIVLAYYDAGVALVEPFLIDTLGLTGLVARPLSPAITVETLLVRHRSTPPSRLAAAFTSHLKTLLQRSRRDLQVL